MKKQSPRKGFTIIEVVLVLAIAGLIFLMVFVAFPALQRSQRDTQRRDDMARFMSQLTQYQSNNNGNIPSDYDKFIANYLRVGGDAFEDPSSGEGYTTVTKVCGENGVTCSNETLTGDPDGVIHVWVKGECSGEEVINNGGKRKVAIQLKLEGAGVYCANN